MMLALFVKFLFFFVVARFYSLIINIKSMLFCRFHFKKKRGHIVHDSHFRNASLYERNLRLIYTYGTEWKNYDFWVQRIICLTCIQLSAVQQRRNKQLRQDENNGSENKQTARSEDSESGGLHCCTNTNKNLRPPTCHLDASAQMGTHKKFILLLL